ncbi:MAG TPA: radical SAM protein [Acidimicrobiales bacterium]|nr:radical SAM protein [Acidimicrobiales bacterium]
MAQLRWRLAGDDAGQSALFDADALLDRHVGTGEFAGTEFLHVNAQRLINRVPASSRMPFEYTINAYRGCSHACLYCYARPTHEYLGLNLGEDFERKIVVKINAVEKVRAELAGRRWAGAPIAMGTNTDPYQRCEGKYRLTRGIIAALIEARNPFSILTKSTLVLRDLDLLQEAARLDLVGVSLSIGTLDEKVWKETEPGTPHPRQRVTAIRRLSEAGIRCGVLVAPVIPGLSDRPDQVAEVVRACRAAGASSVSPIPLHLRPGVKEHYLGWLAQTHPELMDRYQQLYQGRSYLAKRAERRGPTGHEGRRGPEGLGAGPEGE